MSGSAPSLRAGDASPDAVPRQALSDVWVLLDELPRSTASVALTATTIEMAAVGLDAGGRGLSAGRPRAAAREWLGPAAIVATAFVLGAVAGRLTAPDRPPPIRRPNGGPPGPVRQDRPLPRPRDLPPRHVRPDRPAPPPETPPPPG